MLNILNQRQSGIALTCDGEIHQDDLGMSRMNEVIKLGRVQFQKSGLDGFAVDVGLSLITAPFGDR